jgi:hypothetical protein
MSSGGMDLHDGRREDRRALKAIRWTGHGLGEVRSILGSRCLSRDVRLTDSAIGELEEKQPQRRA